MKVGSLVEYVGGQCAIGIRQAPLQRNVYYTVSELCNGKFSVGWLPALYLEEMGHKYAFKESMFKEVQEPMDVATIIEEMQTELI